MLTEEQKHLLEDEESDEEFFQTRRPKSSRKQMILYSYIALLHVICFGMIVLLYQRTSPTKLRHDSDLSNWDNRYSNWVPVEWEVRKENALDDDAVSEFTGLPNDNNTKAWDDLILPSFFSITEAEGNMLGENLENAARLKSGGYLAAIGAYHDLHCIRRLRLFLHSNYYYRDLTDENMAYLRFHLGHCIESLRRSVMCHADTTVATFTWDNAVEVHPGIWRPEPQSNQKRKCMKWDLIENWADARKVPLKPTLLKSDGEEEDVLVR
ncbi:hypothetical protein BDV96DRAFT_648217 [Lophiotrema nucula]|uniref:Tat pathway signal sequence n=1 Tax=Lophiotrema nucula TaxID=690887 RepID=A0A6A5Z1D1_9PLEO|nr:hypothetical protein BDV96DRAFT_648217 [Lophiotrema nucula]